jgi:hypothetical protein
MRFPSRRALVALALLSAAIAAALAARWRDGPLPPPPNTIVPDQLVARLATEALGRVPSQDDWARAGEYFRARGCTAESVAGFAEDVYLGDEYGALEYDPVERALTLYRGVLAREPDAGGMAGMTAQLDAGRDWDDVVRDLLGSHELREQLAPSICAPGTPAYGPVVAPAPADVPASGDGFSGDQAALQQALDATPAGGSVVLARRAVIRLSSTLRIPPGVTLTTAGAPSSERYARMGRLVRATSPGAGAEAVLVDLGPGSRLHAVWVDGGRSWLGTPVRSAVSVRVQGDGAGVEGTKLSEPLGGGNLFISGPHYGVPCASAVVRGNLITSYTSEHAGENWADGISVACARATVAGNAVIDATDVGIILYRVEGGDQASVVEGNVVVAAGRSAFAAFAADPLFGGGGRLSSFNGAAVRDNVLWTGDRTHFDIGLALGTRAWFGDSADKGTGASFTGNTTGELAIRATHPIAVSGMLDATVEDNKLRARPSAGSRCAPAAVAASRSDGWASGSIQGPVTDLPLRHCFTPDHR